MKTEDNRTFEIMYTDLNTTAQREFLIYAGLDKPEDGNYDIVPLAVLEWDTE